ncbi:MAG: hypothetical protein WBS24_06345 [Terriglobales bacterium]
MTKKLLFAAILLSLALMTSCATGGSGPCPANCPAINLTNVSAGVINVDQAPVGGTVVFTAAAQNATVTAVTWSIAGSSCSGSDTSSSNPCGYFSSTGALTATYQAPSSVPSNAGITIVATSQSDSSLAGTSTFTIVHITTAVTPATVAVGQTLAQQFTAVALPDNAPQTFTWTCTVNGTSACASFTPGAGHSGTATYTANDSCSGSCVQISAVSLADPAGCGKCTVGKVSIIPSRIPTGTYAFRFSGYDSSNQPVMVAGTFTASAGTDGQSTVSSGFEDETTSGGPAQHTISGGSYTPASDPNNSNDAGTLSLTTGAYPNTYRVVLDAAGDIQMIESDGHGTGAGVAEPASKTSLNPGSSQTFVFGFSGVDASGNRIGYAGLLPTDGNGNVSGGMMDVNDNGNSSPSLCASPCNVAGFYQQNNNGSWTLTLTSPRPMAFDFYEANGGTSAGNPLTLYAISTDPAATNPTVVGTMTLQNSKVTYNAAAFNGSSISAVTGNNGSAALTYGSSDGAGHFTGGFDENNDGTGTSVPYSPGFAYTYITASGGRYSFQMLGTSSAASPIPFILYAWNGNSGYLLDQSSANVFTGTMTAQSAGMAGSFAPAAMTGPYAVATTSTSLPSIAPLAMNLLLTSPGEGNFDVTGTQYPGSAGDITGGAYNVAFNGTGTLTTMASGTADYVLYAVDSTHFYLMRDATKDAGVPGAILYGSQ